MTSRRSKLEPRIYHVHWCMVYEGKGLLISMFCRPGAAKYTASGTTTLHPACTTTNYQNPDWKQGEIYSSKQVSCYQGADAVKQDT